jgi:hypothetical protein
LKNSNIPTINDKQSSDQKCLKKNRITSGLTRKKAVHSIGESLPFGKGVSRKAVYGKES